jgi:ATP-binding cassette subfamily B multidrug efflux pump
MIGGSVIMLMVTDLRLSLIMFVMLAVAWAFIRSIMRAATPLFTAVQEKLASLNTRVQENLAGVKVVKAFVRERFEIDRFGELNAIYMDQNITVGRLLAMVLPLLGIITLAWSRRLGGAGWTPSAAGCPSGNLSPSTTTC